MSANHSPSRSRTQPHGRRRSAAALLAATAFAIGGDALAQEPIAAVWKAREVDFFYRSSIALLPCHELQSRVSNILRAVGAREDIQVSVTDCDQAMLPHDTMQDSILERSSPFETSTTDRFRDRRREREQSAHVRVRLMSPVAVTPEVLAEINRDKSRRELISRVTGNPAAAMNDPVVFAAQRQTVTLSGRSMRLEPEDCELIEEMARNVFRELDVRVVRGNTMCNRHQASHIAPQLTVETLLPAAMIQQTPVSGGAAGQGSTEGQGTAAQGIEDQGSSAPSTPAQTSSEGD